MAEEIYIPGTVQTPEIRFNIKTGELLISGKSYPENVRETYDDLMLQINEYQKNPRKTTNVDFKWLYYNTATSKIIVEILRILKETDTALTVNWFCREDFKLMIERALLFSEVLEIDINIIHE